MSTTEYQQRIASMQRALQTEAPNISLRMGQTGLSLVKERSIRDGIEVDGAFAEYSDKPIRKSFFKGKALNSAGNAYANSGGSGTYGEFRAVQGRKSDHVNLFYTGRMWTSLGVIAQSRNGYRYSVLIGPRNADEAEILIKNLTKYGQFLTLRKAEIDQVLLDADQDVLQIINDFL